MIPLTGGANTPPALLFLQHCIPKRMITFFALQMLIFTTYGLQNRE